ncbi:hypothetical protein PYW07_012765 [Mythimna separata]|uniref:EGF-like domain-containing protein n=1 Tax=Mythimna separata TaxID=271217 RepID=A0AAD8DLL9_MYTSE|nr:hypothetical protein PYW07_012765 [Mythimna separata]
MHSTRVVAVLTLVVGLAHCFPWDIVVGGDKQLYFYYNGTLTHTEEIPLATQITSVTYDPVHYRVLFTDVNNPSMKICSFDLSTRKIQSLLTTKTDSTFVRVVYDPVTQLLVWKTWLKNIYTFSLNPGSSNKAVAGNLLVHLSNGCRDVAVDSCGGYIYWITDYEIERARLDGSDREVIVDKTVYYRFSLAIDQQTKRIYWIESIIILNVGYQMSIKSANFNGKNQTTIYIAKTTSYVSSLAVSKDFIYWQNSNEVGTWQLPKNSSEHVARKLYSTPSLNDYDYNRVATNYTIQEQIEGIQCEALQNLIPNNSKLEPTASICQNYCLEGNCSVNAKGGPTCSCKAGYSGERCEVSACHKHCLNGGACSLNKEVEPVCQCTAGYDGERCEYSICNEYCLQGNCSVDVDGLPKCSCKTGYSGERCEINACHDYCLHDGVCSLNEENKRVCQCTAGYDGERCDISICNEYCVQGNCSVGADGLPKCSCTTGYSGVRCEENACHKYCLNGGVCSLNEEDEPACQCTSGYDGGRCEVSANKDSSCDAGNSGQGSISTCHQFCLNNGVCSLNEASEPVCQCTADYEGERCEVSVNKDLCCPKVTTVTVTLSQGGQSTCASTVV